MNTGHYRTILAAAVLSMAHFGMAAERQSILEAAEIDMHGFVDVRAGTRTQADPHEKDASLGEARLQLDLERMGDLVTVRMRTDLVYDPVPAEDGIDLDRGSGAIDLREANVMLSPLDFMDIKGGRQILTWGTGDLLFINDMFPKGWQSFFTGRDVEYLKAPSDALLISLFPEIADIDIAYTPKFDPDRYINGSRLSYWNGMLGSTAGRNAIVEPVTPGDWFNEDEIAVRISRNLAGYELAGYLYDGYWKTPRGMNASSMTPYFPSLSVYGASVRGPLGKGLINVEGGYYDSREDPNGTDPLVPNGELRALIGYERELRKNLSMGLQYYIEHMMDHAAYEEGLTVGQHASDEDRQVVTVRLTCQAMNQNLVASFFAYYSPTDQDAYLRPVIKYKATDDWMVWAGGNFFVGKDEHTFFGQFEKNSNVYAGVRRSF